SSPWSIRQTPSPQKQSTGQSHGVSCGWHCPSPQGPQSAGHDPPASLGSQTVLPQKQSAGQIVASSPTSGAQSPSPQGPQSSGQLAGVSPKPHTASPHTAQSCGQPTGSSPGPHTPAPPSPQSCGQETASSPGPQIQSPQVAGHASAHAGKLGSAMQILQSMGARAAGATLRARRCEHHAAATRD